MTMAYAIGMNLPASTKFAPSRLRRSICSKQSVRDSPPQAGKERRRRCARPGTAYRVVANQSATIAAGGDARLSMRDRRRCGGRSNGFPCVVALQHGRCSGGVRSGRRPGPERVAATALCGLPRRDSAWRT
jgi:hypothetical protein